MIAAENSTNPAHRQGIKNVYDFFQFIEDLNKVQALGIEMALIRRASENLRKLE